MGEPEQEWIWSLEDVTVEREAELRVQEVLGELERKVAERTAQLAEATARAQHLADHDALTGLPNRRLLEDRLRSAALSNRNRKASAVMFVDIDRFKMINDSLGHAVGDALLKEIVTAPGEPAAPKATRSPHRRRRVRRRSARGCGDHRTSRSSRTR